MLDYISYTALRAEQIKINLKTFKLKRSREFSQHYRTLSYTKGLDHVLNFRFILTNGAYNACKQSKTNFAVSEISGVLRKFHLLYEGHHFWMSARERVKKVTVQIQGAFFVLCRYYFIS